MRMQCTKSSNQKWWSVGGFYEAEAMPDTTSILVASNLDKPTTEFFMYGHPIRANSEGVHYRVNAGGTVIAEFVLADEGFPL